MIINFEKQTHELTEYEQRTVMPQVIKGLSKRIGKENAITNKMMVQKLRDHGYKVNEPRIRKIIHEIRITGAVECLMATSSGYYISYNWDELNQYTQSLCQRADSIYHIAKQMDYQMRHNKNVL